MKRILIAVVMLGLGGGAYAADKSAIEQLKGDQDYTSAPEPKGEAVIKETVFSQAPVQARTEKVTLQDLRDTRRELYRIRFKKLSPDQESNAARLLHKYGLEILQAEAVLLRTGKEELSPEYSARKVNPQLAELRKKEERMMAGFIATGDNAVLADLNDIFARITEIHLNEETFIAK